MQMEPTPLGEETAPRFENAQEGRAEERGEEAVPTTQAADTAGVDPLTDTPTHNNTDHTTTGGAITSEPESMPLGPAVGSSSAAASDLPAGGSTDRQGSTDSQSGRLAKVPGLSGHVLEKHENAPTFKEKVQGFAKVMRGSTLGNAELKEEGKKILAGEKKMSTSE